MTTDELNRTRDHAAPALRMGRNNQWTPASLRDHYRYLVSHMDGHARKSFAYAVLSEVAKRGNFSKPQARAIALGLELGMNEGIR